MSLNKFMALITIKFQPINILLSIQLILYQLNVKSFNHFLISYVKYYLVEGKLISFSPS